MYVDIGQLFFNPGHITKCLTTSLYLHPGARHCKESSNSKSPHMINHLKKKGMLLSRNWMSFEMLSMCTVTPHVPLGAFMLLYVTLAF